MIHQVQAEIDRLGIENGSNGWRAKAFLYCFEVRCPQSGWLVPLIPSFVISKPRTGVKINVIAELVPDPKNKRYDIAVRSGVTDKQLAAAEQGTVGREGKYGEAFLIHQVESVTYKTKISTLSGSIRFQAALYDFDVTSIVPALFWIFFISFNCNYMFTALVITGLGIKWTLLIEESATTK